ncbi:MAG: mechanosensitive ion channel family protein [Candidatus Aminicenantes bacterium]|nr:mechanosensitive ion channel family protein [Candidatus Aminicenantes bacterium]
MDVLKDIINFISANATLKFALIIVASYIIALLSKIIIKKVLKPLAKRTKTKIDDIIIKNVSKILFYVILLIGVKFAIESFEQRTELFSNIVNSLLVLIVIILLVNIIDSFAKQWTQDWKHRTKTTADDRLIPLLQKILKAVVIILGTFFIFNAWHIDISPLLATAGIAGLAIGLAVKDSLSNILGGLQLVLDKTFKVGDKVKLESGELGIILDIGLRSTKLRTYDNEVIYIPNGYLANAKIKNYTQPTLEMRVNVEFGVEYGSDTDKVHKVVLETLNNIDGVLKDPAPAVHFMQMSDFSLDFVARVWVQSYEDAYSMKLTVTDAIYKGLHKAGIGIPFPTRTIYTKNLDRS